MMTVDSKNNALEMVTVVSDAETVSLKEYDANKLLSSGDLGDGNFGHVLRCVYMLSSTDTDKNQPEYVAVKCMQIVGSEEGKSCKLAKLKKIVLIQHQFQHDNVIKTLGVSSWCSLDGYRYFGIVMEYAEFSNLHDILHVYVKEFSISFKLKFRFLLQIALGLQYLHDMNYVHMDLKPENILMTEKLVPKLTDFDGLQVMQTAGSTVSHTQMYTELYAPPELMKTPNAASASSMDIYSYAMIAYEILTRIEIYRPFMASVGLIKELIIFQGLKPYSRPILMVEIIAHVSNQDLQIFNAIKALMEECWKFNPDERWKIAKVCSYLKNFSGSENPYEPAVQSEIAEIARVFHNKKLKIKSLKLPLNQAFRSKLAEERKIMDLKDESVLSKVVQSKHFSTGDASQELDADAPQLTSEKVEEVSLIRMRDNIDLESNDPLVINERKWAKSSAAVKDEILPYTGTENAGKSISGTSSHRHLKILVKPSATAVDEILANTQSTDNSTNGTSHQQHLKSWVKSSTTVVDKISQFTEIAGTSSDNDRSKLIPIKLEQKLQIKLGPCEFVYEHSLKFLIPIVIIGVVGFSLIFSGLVNASSANNTLRFASPNKTLFEVEKGSTLNIPCIAEGGEISFVHWQKVTLTKAGDVPFETSLASIGNTNLTEYQFSASKGRSELILTNIQLSNNFTCAANTSDNQFASQDIFVCVEMNMEVLLTPVFSTIIPTLPSSCASHNNSMPSTDDLEERFFVTLVIGLIFAVPSVFFITFFVIWFPKYDKRLLKKKNFLENMIEANEKKSEQIEKQIIANSKQMNRNITLQRDIIAENPIFHLIENESFDALNQGDPIPVSNLSAYVNAYHEGNDHMFSEEFQLIDRDPQPHFTWENSSLKANRPKNRNANVVAYDHSRVVLKSINAITGSDYIHANYITGYENEKTYIATQGPLPLTFSDFWRMIWQQNVRVIVMIAKCIENSTEFCSKYWPSKSSETFGDLTVKLVEEVGFADHVIRTISLRKNFKNGMELSLKHYQFTDWPDDGVPAFSAPFLRFVEKIRTSHPTIRNPIVVHCGLGISRTACFICIDAMLQRLKHESTVDIYNFVTKMRSERFDMVASVKQYTFIYDTIVEAIKTGSTKVEQVVMVNDMKKTKSIADIQREFQLLLDIVIPASQFRSAKLACNKSKNRIATILPSEETRVQLSRDSDIAGSDYINASFMDSLRRKKAFIATQCPLISTIGDFWKMLWEHNSRIIVMLTATEAQGHTSFRYWPESIFCHTHQQYTIENSSEINLSSYVVREFQITYSQQVRVVRHFQFLEWTSCDVPASLVHFLEFIKEVHKVHQEFGKDTPITVHCIGGGGRTGMFIALSNFQEQLLDGDFIDIFNEFRLQLNRRSRMLEYLEQYEFCYKALVKL